MAEMVSYATSTFICDWFNPERCLGAPDGTYTYCTSLEYGWNRFFLAGFATLPDTATLTTVTMGMRHMTSGSTSTEMEFVCWSNTYALDNATRTVTTAAASTWYDKEYVLNASKFSVAQLKDSANWYLAYQPNPSLPVNGQPRVDAVWLKVEYTAPPVGDVTQRWNGSAWVATTVKRFDGSAWQTATVKRFDGSAWV